MKTILINNEPTEIVLSESHVAFDEDDHMWEVWETKQLFTAGCCLGHIRFVLDMDDTVLAEALPMFSFSNGFTMVDVKTLDQWKKRLN